jgi:hypothetical protein
VGVNVAVGAFVVEVVGIAKEKERAAGVLAADGEKGVVAVAK